VAGKISGQTQVQALKSEKKIVKSLENWLVDYYITGQAVVMTTEN
jgi:hypothetical protein